uniref:S1 RNA binding domain 1 n=1 Tax=Sinocyclocheilus grahami TaxID=75366 RepID=A0A672NEB5_SINGR
MLDEIKLDSCYRTGNQRDDSEELEEWLPNINEDFHCGISQSYIYRDMPHECPSSSQHFPKVKKEEPDDSFTFDEPAQKKQRTTNAAQGRPIKLKSGNSCVEDIEMNWDPIQVLAEKTGVEQWVCANIAQLFQEENTIPFMVRYRKELINHMDADAVRDVQLTLEELRSVAKKSKSVSQTLKKEGVLTSELEMALKNCTTAGDIDHVYAPYKKGSKLSKARRAKELGLEPVALTLLQAPQTLDLHSSIQPNTKGLSTLDEVTTDTDYLRGGTDGALPCLALCRLSLQVTLLFQTLAINRGENLKILTVKVNVPDWVKNDFCRWCINVRWRPQGFAQPELMTILKNAIEDSYRRFILPFLSRGYRTKLTTSAEKESIAMFVRNLRQRLLMCPVRGRVIMGVDPGFHHGCKIAILSPTSQILHTDVAYLHGPAKHKEAENLRHLINFFFFFNSCQTIVIGNGKACRETEAFFTDLIKQRFFKPLDVSYCITDEAGASIYSVSPEAVKEMPGMDPNLRSAVSIGRRVQDPLAELIKIDPKHIGIGTYQHDVSQSLLRAALDGVVQECVSFVGVDINICSETLMSSIDSGGNEGLKVPLKQTAEKKKVKGSGSASNQFNPLDQTCIHPESYSIALRFLSQIGGNLDQMGSAVLRQSIESSVKSRGLDVLAKSLDTTPETLQLIVDGLTQPPGFDIRQDFEQADFKREIVSMSDLHDGMVLTGRVTNTALFGAFVDIGVGRSGLIPKRFITPDKLPVDQRRRSLALGPGERVEVRVMNVDLQRNRITLDLIRVLR